MVTQSFLHAYQPRAQLVVLSDRRPAPGTARTEMESAIEWAIREHDGIWLVRYANVSDCSEAPDGDSFDRGRWCVFDGFPARQRSSMQNWSDYVLSNASYAEKIIEMVSSDGMVWIYGHCWLLVASALRQHGYRGPIGLSLDIPFPPITRLQALPWYANLMAALCQVDLVGFLTQDCAVHFEACRSRAGQHRPWIGVFPNGIESAAHKGPAERAAGFLTLLGSAARREPREGLIA